MFFKIIFYVLLAFVSIFFQLYAWPFFFIYGLIIIIWSSNEAREVYLLLILGLTLDLLSSLSFGFWFLLLVLIFISCQLIYKYFFREWSILVFSLVFFIWQSIYLFSYLLLSGTKFSFWLVFDLFLYLIFAMILFALFDFSKNWLFKKEILTPIKNKQ